MPPNKNGDMDRFIVTTPHPTFGVTSCSRAHHSPVQRPRESSGGKRSLCIFVMSDRGDKGHRVGGLNTDTHFSVLEAGKFQIKVLGR